MDEGKDSAKCGSKFRVRLCQVILGVIILIDLLLVWYLLVAIPSDCARRATETAGRETCGLMPGAYVVAGIAFVAAVACALVIYRISQKGSGKD